MVKISIIIPVYNASKHIERCLNSCLKQSFADYEVIAVNDGSRDTSGIIIDEYLKLDNRIKAIHQNNCGVVTARKVAVENAVGEYLFFLDADDFLPLNALEVLFKSTNNESSDIIFGDYKSIDESDGGEAIIKYGENFHTTGEDLFIWILENKIGYLWGKLIRRRLFNESYSKKLGDLDYCEDLVQMLDIAFKSNKVVKINQFVYNYVETGESATRSKVTLDVWIKRYYNIIVSLRYSFDSIHCSDQLKFKINRFYLFYAVMFLSLNGSYTYHNDKDLKTYILTCHFNLGVLKMIWYESKKMFFVTIFAILYPRIMSFWYKLFFKYKLKLI